MTYFSCISWKSLLISKSNIKFSIFQFFFKFPHLSKFQTFFNLFSKFSMFSKYPDLHMFFFLQIHNFFFQNLQILFKVQIFFPNSSISICFQKFQFFAQISKYFFSKILDNRWWGNGCIGSCFKYLSCPLRSNTMHVAAMR